MMWDTMVDLAVYFFIECISLNGIVSERALFLNIQCFHGTVVLGSLTLLNHAPSAQNFRTWTVVEVRSSAIIMIGWEPMNA